MSEITIAPAAAERFSDVEHALTGGGDGGSCWCQWFMLQAREWDATTSDQRREMLREDLTHSPTSGLVVYVDGEPAGWVKVSPRTEQPRLGRSRVVKTSPTPFADTSVWAVTCFVVRREHRGQGLSRRLLDAAVDHARAHGARIIEAYPIDTAVASTNANSLFVGALSTFVDAGFEVVARPSERRPVVQLTVSR